MFSYLGIACFLPMLSLRSVSRMEMARSAYDPVFLCISFFPPSLSLSVLWEIPKGAITHLNQVLVWPTLPRLKQVEVTNLLQIRLGELLTCGGMGHGRGAWDSGKSASELALALEALMPVILRSRERGHLAKPILPLRTTEAIVGLWSDGSENGILQYETKKADRFSATRAPARCPSSTP